MPSNATDFKRSEELTLSSGLVVRVRQVNMARIVMTAPEGTLPDSITAQVVRSLTQGKREPQQETVIQFSESELPQLSMFMDSVVRAAVVAPRIVAKDAGADEITLDDLTQAELMDIFNWATRGLAPEMDAGTSFREDTDQ